MPIIVNRIRNFLSETIRNHEFSHTILHKQVISHLEKTKKILEFRKSKSELKRD